jgi:hypothetical protein
MKASGNDAGFGADAPRALMGDRAVDVLRKTIRRLLFSAAQQFDSAMRASALPAWSQHG